MTHGTHEEPWLREAFESLLDGEPPMSATTVWDDVRRGRAARAVAMRRRAALLTAAAGLLLVAGPLTASLRPSPATVSGPSSPSITSTSPTPTPTASSTPLTVTEVLGSAGWTVTDVLTSSPTPTPGSAVSGTQSMYELRSAVGASGVVVTTYPPGTSGEGLLARCTPSTCTDVGGTPPTSDAYQELRRLVADAPGLGAGALVAERVWASGTIVDVGAGPVKPFPGVTAASHPALALTAAQVDAVLDLVGDPYDNPSAQASLAAAQAAGARAKADVAYAEAHPCSTSDLLITQPWHDGATGTMLYGLVLHNRSGRDCGLVGFPSVRLVGPSGALPLAVRRDLGGAGFPMPPAPAAVLLAPGGDAHSLVTKYRCDAGQLRPSRELRVTVNGSGPAAALPFTEWLCAGGAAGPGNVIDVYGFYPGASG